jgi:peptidoglycan/xylan/chitin deacetylase (PgdA/CDA1 family)
MFACERYACGAVNRVAYTMPHAIKLRCNYEENKMKKIPTLTILLIATVVLTSLTVTPRVTAAPLHGAITISFDDAMQSQFDNAWPLMQARGIVGTFYAVSSFIRDYSGDYDRMGLNELHILQNAGNEIASHSVDHVHFEDLSDAQIEYECGVSQQVLRNNGFSADNFAYPYGDTNDPNAEHIDSIVSQYYRSGRSAYGDLRVLSFPPDIFRLPGFSAEGDNTVLSRLESAIDQAYNENGWVQIYFHNVIDGPYIDPYMISTQDFEAFLDYVVAKGMPTYTVNEALDGGVVTPHFSASIGPTTVRLNIGGSQTFVSSISGGASPYSYQWYQNGNQVSGANSSTWTFTPTQAGYYNVFVRVTDSLGAVINSNIVNNILVSADGGEGVISIAFDDGRQDVYANAFPLLEDHGISATFYITTDWIRDFSYDNNYLSIAELRNLEDNGYEIGSHSKDHPWFTYLTDDEIRDECIDSKQLLESYGLSVNNFAYPSGLTNNHVDSIVSQYYRSARSAYEGPSIMPFPTTQFRLTGVEGETDDPSYYSQLEALQDAEDIVDQVVSSKGYAIIFFHSVTEYETMDGYSISRQNFRSFLDYVIASGVKTLTVNQALEVVPLSASISPPSVSMTVGNTQQFTSTATGGLVPYTYQWYYTNNTAITGATTSTLNYKANFTGTYNIYLNVTDNLNYRVKSNTATLNIYSQPTASITPTSAVLYLGQDQSFGSSTTGGLAPYTYQWFINDTAVPQANNPDWIFTHRANGNYRIHVNVTDSLGNEVKSNIASDINVYAVYLMINPQISYSLGEQVSLKVTVLNQQNPKLETSLALTITGPAGYSFYDFQPINVSANSVDEYSFNWIVPNIDGTYIVEASLVPAQLTAYDSKWIETFELTAHVEPSKSDFVLLKNLVSGGLALFVLMWGQVLSGVYSPSLSKYGGNKMKIISSASAMYGTKILAQILQNNRDLNKSWKTFL